VNAAAPQSLPERGRRQLQVVRGSSERLVAALAGVDRRDIVSLGPAVGVSSMARSPLRGASGQDWSLGTAQSDRLPGRTEVAVLREIESWMEPDRLVACRRFVDSEHPPLCSAAAPPDPGVLNPERFLFATRSFPQIHNLDAPAPYIATYEIPLSPLAGESRELTLIDHFPPGCEWRITRAEGVRVEGTLPATRIRLHAENSTPGLLVIEKPFGTAACPSETSEIRYPPCVFETQPGDPLSPIMEAG